PRFIKPKGSTPLSIEKRSLPENRKGGFARLCKARYCGYDRSPLGDGLKEGKSLGVNALRCKVEKQISI
ncbi:MAG: hypothetical protein ACREXW_05095, partial [Gammaproteobacteria bacterium]